MMFRRVLVMRLSLWLANPAAPAVMVRGLADWS
jgi:hypothetical protein